MEGGLPTMALSTSVPRRDTAARPVAGRVVGIDPGLDVTGYAVIDPSARGAYVVEAGVIRTKGAGQSMGRRLELIHQGVIEVLDAYPATSLALEQVHSHIRHPRTA